MMEEENEDTPQIVGLSKWQFLGFLLSALITGAGTFGLGYTLAFFKKETIKHAHQQKRHHTISSAGIPIGINGTAVNAYLNGKIDSTLSNTNMSSNFISYNPSPIGELISDPFLGNQFYIMMGMFKNENNAKNLIAKLKELGKKANIKNHSLYFIVYLGPYESYSLAQTEMSSIELNTLLNGSIVREIPS